MKINQFLKTTFMHTGFALPNVLPLFAQRQETINFPVFDGTFQFHLFRGHFSVKIRAFLTYFFLNVFIQNHPICQFNGNWGNFNF